MNLSEILGQPRGEKRLLVLHDFPVSDAVSSAFADKLISAEYDIESDILNTGKISHSQKIAGGFSILIGILVGDLCPNYSELK